MSEVPSLSLKTGGVGEWEEVTDFHYSASDGTPLRTRVTYDSDDMVIKTEHIVKRVLLSFVLVRQTESPHAECVRVALSTETPTPYPPDTCLPTHVRVKQRKTFEDKRKGLRVWGYELSRTWSGNSRSCTERRQHNFPPQYEVECELVDEEAAYSKSVSDEELAASVLAKARDLLACDDADCLVLNGVRTAKETTRVVRQKNVAGGKRGPSPNDESRLGGASCRRRRA